MPETPANIPIWNEVVIPPQPTLERGEVNSDICVVGLGGSGLAAVGEALALNKRVVGIDAGRIAGGAAGRNGGFLLAGLAKFYHETVARIGRECAKEIYRATLWEIKRMMVETRECVRVTGSLRVGDETEYEDCMAHMQALRADNFDAEPYEGKEGRGLLLPTDGVFHPMEFCRQQVDAVLRGGALLFENTKATKITSGRVETENGIIRTKDIIVAIDGRLESVCPTLHPRVTTHRLQMLATAPDNGVRFDRAVYMRFGHEYLQQLPDGRIAMGGCRDMYASDEITLDGDPTDSVQSSIEEKLRAMGVIAPITHRWAAPVAYTQSGLPIAREIEEGVTVIGAYSGTGNVIGRILGKAAVRAAVTGECDDLRLFTNPE